MKRILFILMAAACAAGCIGDDSILCRDTVMGNIKGGVLYTDGGLKYNIVKTQLSVDVKDTTRILAVCDVMKQAGSDPTEYNVTLLDYTVPLCKAPLAASEVDDWNAVGEDPVFLASGWFSSDYFNMSVQYYFKAASDKVHTLNLVFDDTRSNSDTLHFSLRHNAFGETYGSEDVKDEEVALGHSYATFPIRNLVPEGKKQIVVALSWTWYKGDGAFYTTETCEYKTSGIYAVPEN